MVISNVVIPDPDPLGSVRYSCVFWIDHLCQIDTKSEIHNREISDEGRVFGFLKEHFLHWIESLSLIYKLSEGVLLIRELLGRVQVG